MIIVIGCNKGGAGKTTLATNLAVGLSLKGHDIVLVDSDKQKSASKWHSYRIDEQIEGAEMLVVAKSDNISSDLLKLDEKFDYVIVDVTGANSRELITGASVANLLISPHQASQFDLDTLGELDEQLTRIKDLNPGLKAFVYHSIASTNPVVQKTEREEFMQFSDVYEEFETMKSMNYYRKVYKDVVPKGMSVLEGTNQKAKQEMTDFVEEVLEILGE